MAMSSSVSGRNVSSEMNVTPLIDVLLVLLIIFMVITPSTRGLDAAIPQPSDHSSADKNPRTVVIQVLQKEGKPEVRVNETPVAWNDLGQQLRTIFATRAERVVFIQGQRDIDFEVVAQVIDVAHSVGIENVGLLTAEIDGAKR